MEDRSPYYFPSQNCVSASSHSVWGTSSKERAAQLFGASIVEMPHFMGIPCFFSKSGEVTDRPPHAGSQLPAGIQCPVARHAAPHLPDQTYLQGWTPSRRGELLSLVFFLITSGGENILKCIFSLFLGSPGAFFQVPARPWLVGWVPPRRKKKPVPDHVGGPMRR